MYGHRTRCRPEWLLPALAGLITAACEPMAPGDPGNLVPPTVDEDPSLPVIEMNGSRFHVETFGDPDNPVIVFLHGGPGGDYRSMLRLRALEDDYFLVYWDQRGSGLSRRHGREHLTIDIYLDDLEALIDRYAPDRPVFLVGDSWGGMFATEFINNSPDRVAGAVLVEPGPLTGETMERIKDDVVDLDLASEWLNDWAWGSQFITPIGHARMDYERMLGARYSQPRFHNSTVDPEPVWRLGAAASRYITEDGQNGNGIFTYDFTTNLAAFTVPVLFIAGSLSEILGPSLQSKQVLHYPSASLVVVDGVGHDVAWVRSADVMGHIRTYINAREGGN